MAIRMQIFALTLALAASITAFPTSDSSKRDGQCSQIEIPVTVSEKRLILNITIKDDWDAAALTFNLTARDFGTPDNPLPIVGETTSSVGSNYTIGATLCGTGGTILLTTHGIIESKLYASKPSRPGFRRCTYEETVTTSQVYRIPISTTLSMLLWQPVIVS